MFEKYCYISLYILSRALNSSLTYYSTVNIERWVGINMNFQKYGVKCSIFEYNHISL